MTLSRRGFLRGAGLAAAGGALAPSPLAADGGRPEEAGPADAAEAVFKLTPVGKVEVKDGAAAVRIFEKYAPALKGLEEWSHVNVLYWFDKNDTPQRRATLQVHPRGDRTKPITGVFACRSPMRPNLLALTVCKIVAIEGAVVRLDKIDALDGTPVLDLKPFIPPDAPSQGIRVPDWARGGPGKQA